MPAHFWTFLLLFSGVLSAAPRWESQFFHDVDGEEMKFSSIGFCSGKGGVAVGGLAKGGSFKPIAMVTSDAGRTWTRMQTEEHGYGVFFLDETSGWMLTRSGIWFTDECGRNWRRIHKQRDLQQVRFVSRERGWAVGANKTAIETSDGGKTWTKVAAVTALDLDPSKTVISVIAPISPREVIMVGRRNPREIRGMPLWLDPNPERRRERPAITVTLETRDAGATWNASKVSMFGRVSALRTSSTGLGVFLVEFDEYFEFPSELHTLDLRTAKSHPTLRRKDFAVTDIAASNVFYAAGFEPAGAMFRAPIPGKVRISQSEDGVMWKDCEVDYRAVAAHVSLAESGGKFWAATDTGMILTLVPN